MSLFQGQEAVSHWREAMNGSRMHHAWLLAGARGLGKIDFARQAAGELVGLPPGRTAANHPDIVELAPLAKDEKEEKKRLEGKPFETKRNITVGQIRDMQRKLTTRPTLGDRRAIIIDPADDLEKSAANALLKSLEEPPAGTFFLLVAHRPARLLPTIRSRCRTLRFSRMSDDEVAEILAERLPGTDAEQRAAAVRAANGSPGAALEFLQLDLGTAASVMQSIVEQGDRGGSKRDQLARIVGARPDRERMQTMLELARSVLGRQLGEVDGTRLSSIIDVHTELVALTGQAPTYNFDAGLLTADIGNLLARAGPPSERADA